MSDVESALQAFREAFEALEEVAADLTLTDAASLSDYQLRLGAIVLQVVETQKTLADLSEPRP